MTFVISGTASSFDEGVRRDFQNRLAALLNVDPGEIRLNVAPASVQVTATIIIPDAATAAAAVVTIQSTPSATLNAALGQTIVQTPSAIAVPVVVDWPLPPPSSPPLPSVPPPSPPPHPPPSSPPFPGVPTTEAVSSLASAPSASTPTSGMNNLWVSWELWVVVGSVSLGLLLLCCIVNQIILRRLAKARREKKAAELDMRVRDTRIRVRDTRTRALQHVDDSSFDLDEDEPTIQTFIESLRDSNATDEASVSLSWAQPDQAGLDDWPSDHPSDPQMTRIPPRLSIAPPPSWLQVPGDSSMSPSQWTSSQLSNSQMSAFSPSITPQVWPRSPAPSTAQPTTESPPYPDLSALEAILSRAAEPLQQPDQLGRPAFAVSSAYMDARDPAEPRLVPQSIPPQHAAILRAREHGARGRPARPVRLYRTHTEGRPPLTSQSNVAPSASETVLRRGDTYRL